MLQPLYLWEWLGTPFVGGWVGPRAGLDGSKNSCPLPVFNPQTVQPVVSRNTNYTFPAPTLFWHTTVMTYLNKIFSLFDVRKSVHHHTIQINQPTRCNNFTSLLLDSYVWLNMFRVPLRPSSGTYNCTRSLWFYRWSVVVGALLVVVWQTTTNNAPTVEPEAPSAVVRSWWWAERRPKHVEPHINIK